jgi:hypothetical protein
VRTAPTQPLVDVLLDREPPLETDGSPMSTNKPIQAEGPTPDVAEECSLALWSRRAT